jgi:DNA modification methylase
LKHIESSIRRFGFTTPLLISDELTVIAGHGRLLAAKKLGLEQVPCIRLSHLSADERRAYLIADNRTAELAGWSRAELALELKHLSEIDFDFTSVGFDLPEVDLLIQSSDEASPTRVEGEDDVPSLPSAGEVVCREGDHWTLGRHGLVIGDAKDPTVISRLMWGRKAAMIFTDPPYNVKINGHVCGSGKTRHREFVEASGEMSRAEFVSFLSSTLGVAARACKDGAIAYVFMDWRHMGELLEAGAGVFTELKNLCVWAKNNGGMGTFYRSRHELVFVWKVGTAPHTNNFGLGDKGRYRTNVWSNYGVNSFGSDRMEQFEMHPTVKPVALVADAIRDVSHRGEIVLDCFGGSGTTLVAAEMTGRVAKLVELDAGYGDVIIRRYEKLTGAAARLASSGKTFAEVASERAAGREMAA